MNEAEKRQFINNLCESVKSDLLDKVPQMPEAWDGFELRELIADTFRQQAYMLQRNKRRYKEYENDRIVLNL